MSTHGPVFALLQALQRIGGRCDCDAHTKPGHDCVGTIARSALASWESRPRLDDDVDLVAHITVEVVPNVSLPDVRAVLAEVEAHMFGAPGKGTT